MSIQPIESNLAHRDKLFSREIYRFVKDFQNIRINVPPETVGESVYVFVHAPYMCYGITLFDNEEQLKRIKERHRNRLQKVKEARDTADEGVNKFFDRQFYKEDGREKTIACGRAELTEIRLLLQKAVDQGLIPMLSGKKFSDEYVLRTWLKKYGVGIDCSSFVQQALKRLLVVSHSEVGEKSDRKSSSNIRFLRSQWVYRDITGHTEDEEKLFSEVSTPVQARPGDVVVSQTHIRIVASVEIGEGEDIIFELAESTSDKDVVSGETYEETDIGPRIIQVKYTKPNQPIVNQTPLKKRLIDDIFNEDKAESAYIIGRFLELERLWHDTESK